MTFEEDLEFPPFTETEVGDQGQEMTFEELYGEALLAPFTITIPYTDIEKVETGVKNYKARALKKAAEQGIEMEKNKLCFESKESIEAGEGWVDMTISTIKPASVRVRATRRSIPILNEE